MTKTDIKIFDHHICSSNRAIKSQHIILTNKDKFITGTLFASSYLIFFVSWLSVVCSTKLGDIIRYSVEKIDGQKVMNPVNPGKEISGANPALSHRWSAVEKGVIVRSYLRDGVSQADLVAEYGVTPRQISQWSKQALEGIEAIFQGSTRKAETAHQKEILQREKKIHQLQDVVSELSREVLQLKKAGGVR